MEEASVYERKRIRAVYYKVASQHPRAPKRGAINSVVAKGVHTSSHASLLRYQRTPGPYIPHRLDADNPEGDNERYDQARKQRQAEHIGARATQVELRDYGGHGGHGCGWRIGGGGIRRRRKAPSQPDGGFRCLVRVVKISSAELKDTLRQFMAALEGWFGDLPWGCPQKFCTVSSSTTSANLMGRCQPRLITDQSQGRLERGEQAEL